MITFILIFAVLILGFGGWMIANGANQRKRAGQADKTHVEAQQTGSGAPGVGRALAPTKSVYRMWRSGSQVAPPGPTVIVIFPSWPSRNSGPFKVCSRWAASVQMSFVVPEPRILKR